MSGTPGRATRRQFVRGTSAAGLALLAGCGRLPFQSQAERQRQVPRIGFLGSGSGAPYREPFRQGLHELGYVEGENVVVEERFAENQADGFLEIAAEFVRLPVDVIVAPGIPGVMAARDATSTIPIVMVTPSDPVGSGLIASLAHPGGNVTGLSLMAPQLSAKQLQLLKEAAPAVSRVAVLGNPTNPGNIQSWREIQAAAPTLAVQARAVEVRGPDELDGAFAAVLREGADGLVVLADAVLNVQRVQIVDFAAHNRLPALYGFGPVMEWGGLMAYGPSIPSMYRRAAYYVDRILKATKPADLPVEQPREFDFVINLKTAQALGLTIPEHVLLQATEVLQ
jgi:putative ABC transport system substrate-binding protein